MTKLEEQRPQTSRSRQCAPPACASSTPWTIIKNTDVEIETDKRRAVMKLLQDDLAHDAAHGTRARGSQIREPGDDLIRVMDLC